MSRQAAQPAATDANGRGPEGPFPRFLARIITAIDWTGRIVAASCMAFMFVLLLLNVILRYAFGDGIAWAYEIHALLLPWLVAGGIVIATAQGRNIAVTLLPDMTPPPIQRALGIAIQLAIMAISVSVLWSSQPILRASQFQDLATLGIKQVWGYSSLVFAFGAMSVIACLEAIRLTFGGALTDADPAVGSLS